MAKNTQGFSAQGTRGVAPKNLPQYSREEMAAIGKLERNSGMFGGNVALCDLCGRPIASQSPYEKPEDNYPYLNQAQAGRHFACHQAYMRKQASDEEKRVSALSPEQREEEEARKFNEGNTVDTRAENPELRVYRPAPGEISFDKVKAAGGISNVIKPNDPLAGLPQPTAEEEAEIDRQTREREAMIAQEFARMQAEINQPVATNIEFVDEEMADQE